MSSFSTSDLDFYSVAGNREQTESEDNLRTELQLLLKQLVEKTKAAGGILMYDSLGRRTTLVSGETDKEFELAERERQQLLAGQSIKKEGTHIRAVTGRSRLLGIICINIDEQTWQPLCRELAAAYARLASNSFEMNRERDRAPESTDSLLEKKRELEQIQQYNQNLLSITAHDLSSPLNAVSGYLDMIDEYLESEDHASKLYHYYKRIQSGVSDVSDMLTQLNEVIKLKKGFLTLDNATIEAGSIVEEVCGLLSNNAGKKDVSLDVDVNEMPVYINADEVKFKRIIYNLVSNAIKYSRRNKSIRIRTATKGEQLYVYIRDRGTGILEEDMKTIFDPFVKHDGQDSQATSYGLGLYISSYFTKLMNGKILAESENGKGSTFTVVMPLATAPEMQSRPA